MTYEVVIEDLRAAAGDVDAVASGFPGNTLNAPALDGDAVGHIELAAWLKAVVEQADQAGTALHDGAVQLAEALRTQAADFETADDNAVTRFGGPFGSPFGQPPFGSPFGPPVYGPPVPGGAPR